MESRNLDDNHSSYENHSQLIQPCRVSVAGCIREVSSAAVPEIFQMQNQLLRAVNLVV